jgi:hypothetical protein
VNIMWMHAGANNFMEAPDRPMWLPTYRASTLNASEWREARYMVGWIKLVVIVGTTSQLSHTGETERNG